MKRARSWLPPTVFALMLATCGAQIARNALAAPVTQPVEKDKVKAQRVAVSRVGGPDEHLPLPAVGPDVVGGNGVVEPAQRETHVAAQATALVKAVHVTEGQQVKSGEVLVELVSDVEAAALAAAEADLEGERASMARTLKGLRIEDVDAAQADADAARSRAQLSAGVLERTEQLSKTGATTADELDRAKRQAQADEANARALEARARAASAGSRREDVAVARARLAGAEARVAEARATLERLTVRAPLDAEVLQVKVRPGELYSSQGEAALVVLGDTRRLRVRMDVDERDVARVRVGAPAYVQTDAWGDRRFPGRVVEIARRFGRKNVSTDDPTEKNDTRVLETLIELDSNEALIPGQRVTCFVTATSEPG